MTTATPAGTAPVRIRKRPNDDPERSGEVTIFVGVGHHAAGLEPDPVSCFDNPAQTEAPPVRIRRRPICKRMDPSRGFDFLFAETDGRHDFLEATFKAKVRGTPEAIRQALRRLAGRGLSGTRDIGVFRTRARAAHSWHVDTVPDRALFQARGTADLSPDGCVLALDLKVQLNPTRWLAHQADPVLSRLAFVDPRTVLCPDPAVTTRLAAMTLDGGDNLLHTPEQVPGFGSRGEWWPAVVRLYTGKVRQLIIDTLAPSVSQAVVDRADFGSIRKAETQWEFHHPDAVSWVATLRNALNAADDASQATRWHGTKGCRNAVTVYLGLTDCIRLKVYAKDANRIRFEIVFSEAARITQINKRLGLSHQDSFCDRLMRLRVEAVKQMSKVWETVMHVTREAEGTVKMLDFMALIGRLVPAQHQRLLLSKLGNDRRVTATPAAGFAPDPVCRALLKEGVLVKAGIVTRGPARYALAPRWSGMFDDLLGRSEAARALH